MGVSNSAKEHALQITVESPATLPLTSKKTFSSTLFKQSMKYSSESLDVKKQNVQRPKIMRTANAQISQPVGVI